MRAVKAFTDRAKRMFNSVRKVFSGKRHVSQPQVAKQTKKSSASHICGRIAPCKRARSQFSQRRRTKPKPVLKAIDAFGHVQTTNDLRCQALTGTDLSKVYGAQMLTTFKKSGFDLRRAIEDSLRRYRVAVN